VAFTLTLEQSVPWRFGGSVQDGDGGMPDVGAIDGRVAWRCVMFSKRMPRYMVVHADEVMTAREHFALTRPNCDIGELAHPTIRYIGMLSSDGRQVRGLWRVGWHHVPGIGFFPPFSGTWDAQRELL
jgi:hypothetical protein